MEIISMTVNHQRTDMTDCSGLYLQHLIRLWNNEREFLKTIKGVRRQTNKNRLSQQGHMNEIHFQCQHRGIPSSVLTS